MKGLIQKVKALVNKLFIKKEPDVYYKLLQKTGQQCYELDIANKHLKLAEYKNFNTPQGVKSQLVVNNNCLYCIALNEKNAARKFRQQILSLLNKKA